MRKNPDLGLYLLDKNQLPVKWQIWRVMITLRIAWP